MSTAHAGVEAWSKVIQCKHYNGVIEKVCRAGVRYEALVPRGPTWLGRLPCLVNVPGEPPSTCTCAARALPTAQELAAKDAELRAALEARPPFLRMFYAAHGELLDRLYDDWCRARRSSTCCIPTRSRSCSSTGSARMPEELAAKRSLAGIP